MRIALDTHVHLYPSYDLAVALSAAQQNLGDLAQEVGLRVLCLTERNGQTFFADLAGGRIRPTGWSVSPGASENLLHARAADGRSLAVLAGRQIIAAERIEVLALGRDLRLSDGLPARDILEHVRASGAIAVLPWGLGKWLGARGRLVGHLLANAQPGELAVADTFLLPGCLPRPPLLRRAAARGLRALAGTDPLNRAGEERLIGRYGVTGDADLPEDATGDDLLRLLGDPATPLHTAGRRGGLTDLARAF